ncbi:MAG: hypothetical protein HKL86_05750 [Acidimicrobiaceae bacterium]|nr:hypothetical protein [Acidimicrobiaceae bacterium]
MIEFVSPPELGRCFGVDYIVRLGDVGPDGVIRPDGVARHLQDVATDDWEDTGVDSSDVWVVRRTSIRLAQGGRWPNYKERMRVTTWCGGVGAAWAERRTNFEVDGTLMVEAAALWVPVDPGGHPVRIRESFYEVYGESIRGRKVSGRIAAPVVAEGATFESWPLRRADLDVVGHVNNAALWQAVSQVAPTPLSSVQLTHHGSIVEGDVVTLARTFERLWLLVDGSVQVAAEFSA